MHAAFFDMIVIDATPLQTGHRYRGIGSYTAGLLDAITASHRSIPLGLLVQSPHPDDHPLVADLVRRPGVTAVSLHRPHWRRSRLQWLWGLVTITPVLCRVRPRLYHAVDGNGLVHVPGVTTVATLYDLIPLHQVRGSFSLRRVDDHLGYARYLRLLQRVDRILAISEATKRDAIERLRIPAERITAIPLAVDERRFYARSSEEIERVLTRHAVRRPYFLHVGSSDPNKNTDNILRAFSQFCRQRPEHALYIAGKWPIQALEPLRASYAHLLEASRLRMLDFVPDDDLPALYSGAEALIYPSLLEGFGLPVLEAMCCATPVLTSSTSSLPEVAGDAALLVNPHNVEEILWGMQRLADDSALRAELVTRGLQQVKHFTFRRTAEDTLRVYHELL